MATTASLLNPTGSSMQPGQRIGVLVPKIIKPAANATGFDLFVSMRVYLSGPYGKKAYEQKPQQN